MALNSTSQPNTTPSMKWKFMTMSRIPLGEPSETSTLRVDQYTSVLWVGAKEGVWEQLGAFQFALLVLLSFWTDKRQINFFFAKKTQIEIISSTAVLSVGLSTPTWNSRLKGNADFRMLIWSELPCDLTSPSFLSNESDASFGSCIQAYFHFWSFRICVQREKKKKLNPLWAVASVTSKMRKDVAYWRRHVTVVIKKKNNTFWTPECIMRTYKFVIKILSESTRDLQGGCYVSTANM